MGNVNNNKQRKHFFFEYLFLSIFTDIVFLLIWHCGACQIYYRYLFEGQVYLPVFYQRHLSTKISDNTQEPTFVNGYCFHFWKSWDGVYRVNFQNLGCYWILDEKCLAQQNICIRLIAVNDTLTTAFSIQDKRCRF